jgi:asparagine synthase (glutamine-hydrolysing)
MGAIFGFSGWSGKKSRAMETALRHRGKTPARTHASIRSTACWLPPRSDHGGIIEHKGQVVALAGRVFADRKETRMARLLRGYREQGLDFVRELRGSYVLAVLDGDSIHLVRDAAGSRAIYYGLYNGRFIFAVEPKGVLAWPGFARNLRPAAVAQYFSFGFAPGTGTMLENLWELPPGHTVTFTAGRVEPPRRFFFFEEVEKENEGDKEEQEWLDEFSHLHKRAVTDRFPVSGSAGLFLSGGISSAAVGAEVMRQSRKKLPSWSICFEDQDPHGLEASRAVAEHIGSDHREILIQPKDFLPRLKDIISSLDEPIGDPSVVSDYMLSDIAAQEVDYVFTGAGGDPVFGGGNTIPMLLGHWYGGVERGSFFREQAYLSACGRAYDNLNQLLTPEWRGLYNSHEALEGMLTPFFQSGRPENFLDKLCAVNICLQGGHMRLPKMERMAGAHGLTPLSPLFDERLIELSFRMPSTLKVRRGMAQIILRQTYKDALPERILTRPDTRMEKSMRFPVHFWFRKELKSYARKILSRREIRRAGIFNPDRVNELLRFDPERSRAQDGLTLWMLITFELWRRQLSDNIS